MLIKYSFAFASLLFFFIGCSDTQQKTQQQKTQPLQVDIITVEKKNVPIWVTYTGKTKASSSQEVRARVSGILEKRYFKDGAYVHKGEKLFKIEQSSYKAALKMAYAQKAQDRAALHLAHANVKRYAPLVQEGLAPRATLEEYQAKEASLRAILLGDDAKIARAKLDLSYTTIKAPISGYISVRYVDVGNLVGKTEATLLTTIVQYNPLYAYFSPSQKDVAMFNKYKIKQNPDAFIEVEGTQERIRLDGYVDFSNNIVDPLTSTISMRAVIDNKDAKILPGSFVYVHIFITDKQPFIMIPPEVIFHDQLGAYVYTVDNNNTLQRADITTGYGTRHYVAVTQGLKSGDKVVVSSLMKLQQKLAVIPHDVTKERGIDAILNKNNLIPSSQQKED